MRSSNTDAHDFSIRESYDPNFCFSEGIEGWKTLSGNYHHMLFYNLIICLCELLPEYILNFFYHWTKSLVYETEFFRWRWSIVLLIICGYACRINVRKIPYWREHRTIVVGLPRQISHALQTPDIGVFGHLIEKCCQLLIHKLTTTNKEDRNDMYKLCGLLCIIYTHVSMTILP